MIVRTVVLAALWLALALVATGAAAAERQRPPADQVPPGLTGEPLPPKVAPVAIDGFRSAQFGMTETKVRLAIRKDFGDVADSIVRAMDDVEKTTALQITVDNLLSVAGKAKISYILGYQSHTLIQVTVGWGATAGTETSSEALVDAADDLRAHLLSKPFKTENVLVDWLLPDGSIVVFRGRDDRHHTVLLVLAGEKQGPAANTGAADAPPSVKITTMMLSYLVDSGHPDIFRLRPEAF